MELTVDSGAGMQRPWLLHLLPQLLRMLHDLLIAHQIVNQQQEAFAQLISHWVVFHRVQRDLDTLQIQNLFVEHRISLFVLRHVVECPPTKREVNGVTGAVCYLPTMAYDLLTCDTVMRNKTHDVMYLPSEQSEGKATQRDR